MTIMFAFLLSVAKVNTNANKEEGELNCNRKIPWGEEKGDGSSQDWFQALNQTRGEERQSKVIQDYFRYPINFFSLSINLISFPSAT